MGHHVLHIATANAVVVLCMSKLPLGRQTQQTSIFPQEQYWVNLYASRVMKPIKTTNAYAILFLKKETLADTASWLAIASRRPELDNQDSFNVFVLCKSFAIQPMT